MNSSSGNADSENKKLRVGLAGATGLVGRSFLNVLNQWKFEIENLHLYASDKSIGKTMAFGERQLQVEGLPKSFSHLDVLFVCTGEDLSLEVSPRAVSDGVVVIDNSSAHRQHPEVPLVVPEVNGKLLQSLPSEKSASRLIANPNCTTIQLVTVLHALRAQFDLERIFLSTYQSVSGAGLAAVEELQSQTETWTRDFSQQKHSGDSLDAILKTPSMQMKVEHLPAQLFNNCLPQIGGFRENGLSSEEEKVRLETKKILNLQLPVSVFAVRVPVLNSHAMAVWVQVRQKPTEAEVIQCLQAQSGVFSSTKWFEKYPLQSELTGTDLVGVGRVHIDPDDPHLIKLWIVADNLRVGAATNAIRIAQSIFQNDRIDPSL